MPPKKRKSTTAKKPTQNESKKTKKVNLTKNDENDENEKKNEISETDIYDEMTVAQLKDQLTKLGRSTKGNRSVLIKRLKDIKKKEDDELERKAAEEDKKYAAEKEEELFDKNATNFKVSSGYIKVGSWNDVTETRQLPKPTGGTIRIDPLPVQGYNVLKGTYYVYHHSYLQLIFHESCTIEWLTKVIEGICKGQYFGRNYIPEVTETIEIGRYDWLKYLDNHQVHVVYCVDSSLTLENKKIPKVFCEDDEDHMSFNFPPRFFADKGAVMSANTEYRYGLVLDKKCFVCTGYEVEGETPDIYLKGIQKVVDGIKNKN